MTSIVLVLDRVKDELEILGYGSPGSNKKEILYDQGNLTGIAYIELPSTLA
jgi:hypothetical protein